MGLLTLKDLPHYTVDDYLKWEGKWELISGIPYSMSQAPDKKHQKLSGNIHSQLLKKLKNCKLFEPYLPIDWKIDDDTIVQPDNLVVCNDIDTGHFLTITPSIIFEILSPSTAIKDKNIKMKLYEMAGVNYYVILNPDNREIQIFKLNNKKLIKTSEMQGQIFTFNLGECSFDFDFSLIWG